MGRWWFYQWISWRNIQSRVDLDPGTFWIWFITFYFWYIFCQKNERRRIFDNDWSIYPEIWTLGSTSSITRYVCMYVRDTFFLSNHNVHKNSCGLSFWVHCSYYIFFAFMIRLCYYCTKIRNIIITIYYNIYDVM